MIYLVIVFLLLVLAVRYDIWGNTRYRDKWYNAMLVVFILVAGLRYRFAVDTIAYLYHFYNTIPTIDGLHIELITTYKFEPFWILMNSLVKTFHGKFFIVQLLQAGIVNVLIFKYIKKHSPYPFLCIFLYFIMDYHWYNMMVMRNAIAFAICLFANDYIMEKKWTRAFIAYGVAGMFHYSSLVFMFITPFLTSLRFDKKGLSVLLAMLPIGAILVLYFEDILMALAFNDTVSDKLDTYMENDAFDADRYNIVYFFVIVFIPAIYTILSLYYVKRFKYKNDLEWVEPFVMIGLIFYVLRFNIGFLHRFSNAYHVYFIIFYVQFFMDMYRKGREQKSVFPLLTSTLIFIPYLFVTIALWYQGRINYYPYYTVIDKNIDYDRELHYLESRPYIIDIDEDTEY